MTVTSAHIRIEDPQSLRPGDPVPITVQLPDGDVQVQGWCEEVRFGIEASVYTAAVVFFNSRKRDETELLDPEAF